MYNPNDYKQTHDPMGREFTDPMPGGPIPGKTNITIGESKAGGVIISVIRDAKATDIFLAEEVTQEGIMDVLEPVRAHAGAESYDSCQAYYRWYETFVTDVPFADIVDLICQHLNNAGLDWESH